MIVKNQAKEHPVDFEKSFLAYLQKKQPKASKIGFRKDDESQEIETKELEIFSTDDTIKLRGMQKAIEVLQDYFSNYKYPFITGKKREEFTMQKLAKIRSRYFEPI